MLTILFSLYSIIIVFVDAIDVETITKNQIGIGISIGDQHLIVGAFKHNGGPFFQSGAAYVYTLNSSAGSWTQTAKLEANDRASLDDFGRSIALHSKRALIGANQENNNIGAAYIFDYNDTSSSWTETAKLIPIDGSSGDFFGFYVALQGDIAAIGSPNNDGTGSVYIFEYNNVSMTWNATQKLSPSNGISGDYFGSSLALQDANLIIGAYVESGSAYIFIRNSTNGIWTETDKLIPNSNWSHQGFGVSVGLYGDRAIVGAFLEDENGENSGSAYIFTRNYTSGSWEESAKIVASDGTAGDAFGRFVLLIDDIAIVTTIHDDAIGENSGSLYVYQCNHGSWTEIQKITAPAGST
eukprot:300291_1